MHPPQDYWERLHDLGIELLTSLSPEMSQQVQSVLLGGRRRLIEAFFPRSISPRAVMTARFPRPPV